MKLAVLVLAHKNPGQIQLLVDTLLRENCSVFVHIDKKAGSLFRDFFRQNTGRPQLYLYSRYKVYWGSYNQIRATFFLLGEAYNRVDFDFVRLISGQDLPARPLKEFFAFLESNRAHSFFSYSALPDTKNWSGNGGLDRVEWFWITNFPRRLGFFFNKLNVLIHMVQDRFGLRRRSRTRWFGGANWFTLNREMAGYVCEQIKTKPETLKRYRNTRLADEIILQTILMNSRYAPQVVNATLSFVDWHTGPEYPRTFTAGDHHRIVASGEFFARKFDSQKDTGIIQKIIAGT